MKNKKEKFLLESLKNGSYKAFTDLYNEWSPLLFRFAFSLIKSRIIAEEIVQNTFIKIWDNHKNIEIDKSFKAYLFTISYHLILKEFRYQLNHPQIEDYMTFSNNIAYSNSPDTYKIDFDYFLAELDKAKLSLSPRQREIFEMNKEKGLSIKEIVERLELTEQTVRNQLSASLKIIRQQLGHFLSFLFFI